MITFSENRKAPTITILSNGLTVETLSGQYQGVSTETPLDGKKYFEVKIESSSSTLIGAGLTTIDSNLNWGNSISGSKKMLILMLKQGMMYVDGSSVKSMSAMTDGDTVGISIDTSTKDVGFYKNGIKISSYNYAGTAIDNQTLYPLVTQYPTSKLTANFGMKTFMLESLNAEEWDSLSENGYLAYDRDLFLIRQNGSFYTIKNNALEVISCDITEDVIQRNGVSINELNAKISLIHGRFEIIGKSRNTFELKGIRSQSELVVASNDFYTTVKDHIDYFKCESERSKNGAIKIVFSDNNGASWKTHNGVEFVGIDSTIPMKDYSEMSSEEKSSWDAAKKEIILKGIDSANLHAIDFNTITSDTIRFAYVICVGDVNDTAINKRLIWQFDSKGSMQQMSSQEYTLRVTQNTIEIKSLISSKMIKANILPNGSHVTSSSDFATIDDVDEIFM